MTALSKNTTHYQRFIPKEEVQAVEAWQFQPMGAPPPSPAPEPEAAPPTPPEPSVEEVRTQAYAEGFEHGRLAGAQTTRTELEQPLRDLQQTQSERWLQLLAQLDTSLQHVQHQLSHQLLELACDLARQVVRHELQNRSPSTLAVVQEALDLVVQGAQPTVVRLHPSDVPTVEAALGAHSTGTHVRYLGDERITPGGCLVETASGGVDATIEKRWTRAVANLGLNAPWAPGEQADV